LFPRARRNGRDGGAFPSAGTKPKRGRSMRKFLMVMAGLCAFGALWKAEAEEDGAAVALSPFIAAAAIEIGILLLRRGQTRVLRDA
jgi:hypothetical protein